MAVGLLVSYSGYPHSLSSFFPDNGLASLAAALHSEQHEIEVLDFGTAETVDRMVEPPLRAELTQLYQAMSQGAEQEHFERLSLLSERLEARAVQVEREIATRLVKRCESGQIDFVGFKLWSGRGFSGSLHIAERLRERCPEVKLFAGGPAVHYSGPITAQFAPVFDAVIDGDGEEAILELARVAEGRRPLEGIPNLCQGKERTQADYVATDLSTHPLPLYNAGVYPSIGQGDKLKLFSIDESRGCPMRCAFCVNWCIEGHKWRSRTPEQVVGEMRSLQQLYGPRIFRLAGTYTPPSLLKGICYSLQESGLDAEFGLYLHASGVDEALLDLLVASGCYGIFFGVESGSDTILKKAMNKSITAHRLEKVLTAALDRDLIAVGSFIVPAPLETEETAAETRAFVQRVFAGRPNAVVAIVIPGLLPDTGWWKERKRYGFELTTSEEEYRRAFLTFNIRHLLPPTLWQPLSYRLSGLDYKAMASQNASFQEWLGQIGLTTNLAEYDIRIGLALGMKAVHFRQKIARLVFTGDAEGLQQLIDDANQVITL